MNPTTAKILVVDDDPGMLDTLRNVLTATRYETSMASSGHAAIAKAMMTAYTQDELVAESQRTTGFEVFSKPLDLDRVLPLVKRIVTSRPSGPSKAT